VVNREREAQESKRGKKERREGDGKQHVNEYMHILTTNA